MSSFCAGELPAMIPLDRRMESNLSHSVNYSSLGNKKKLLKTDEQLGDQSDDQVSLLECL